MVKSLLLAAVLSSQAFSHDLEIKINGLVCSSCGIGIKRGFKREFNVNDVKFDVRKQLALVLSLIHISEPRDPKTSRMPSSA